MRAAILGAAVLGTGVAQAHMAAWATGMYCRNGTTGTDNQNTADAVAPLFNLTFTDWWFHHYNGCDEFPPSPGDFLELPAGGNFSVEIAENRAFTSLSYGGSKVTEWGDGKTHPEDYSITNLGGYNITSSGCIPSPNMHAQNESMAAGTAFAISYNSDLKDVTPENLVVFSIRYHTPFRMVTSYDVPAALPACPPGGCHCAWGWVPDHCGTPNIYMEGFRCNVTGATSTTPVAPGKPPVWCEGDSLACQPGPKQMVYWNQLDGNNVILDGWQLEGNGKSPGYNMKMGFYEGMHCSISGVGVYD
ncbi:hypothetical protein BV25DRAFT_1801323 [Artomyces pyxidatus]|uniref:Uncharacterized protein n=1 Tax=Artomyces pyxidatus TaxID=48021 RepID=A0ACB8T668_9AGAM|nr:hypothetical protein BV25DRAFT_1801323 [Artomyces pyxidatus]